MQPATAPAAPSAAPAVTREEIQQLVDDAVKRKVAEYRRLLYAFLAGFALLLTGLLGDHWWNDGELLQAIRARAVAFEVHISRMLGKTVAFSYTNQYWLDNVTGQQSLAFYATRSQSVVAFIEVLHSGSGEKLPVSVLLDRRGTRLSRTEEDLHWEKLDLTKAIQAEGEEGDAGRDNVHYLVFVAEHKRQSQDRVFVRVLLNIVGLEKAE